MDIIGILLFILCVALIGFVVYLITTYIPMPPIFAQVIQVGVAILIILYILMLFVGNASLPHLARIR